MKFHTITCKTVEFSDNAVIESSLLTVFTTVFYVPS